MKKNHFFKLLLLILILILASNILVYAITKKSIMDCFSNNNNATKKSLVDYFFTINEKHITNELLKQSGKSYEIDDYIITLEEYLCEEKTDLGYLVFSIEKKEGKPFANIDSNGYCTTFGENNRFSLNFISSGTVDKKFEYVDDTLYAYISYYADEFMDESIDEKIVLTDYKQPNGDDGYKDYYFDVTPVVKSNNYKFENSELYISPLGLKIFTKGNLDNINIETTYNNGENETLIDTKKNIGTNNLGERCKKIGKKETTHIYTLVFNDLKDISKIKKLKFNNKILELNN